MAYGKRRCRDIKLKPKSEWRSPYSRHRLDPDRNVRAKCSSLLMDILAAQGIPEYLDIRSNRVFSYRQKIVLLVMMEWMRLSFRRFEEESDSNIQMFAAIGLDICPDYSTLCKFRKTVDPEHLSTAVTAFACIVGPGATVAIDGTALANYDRSAHYVKRMDSFGVVLPRTTTKLSIAADTETKIILAHEVDAAEPRKHDVKDVPSLVSKLRDGGAEIGYVVADKGYDSEDIHRLIGQILEAKALIPARDFNNTYGKDRNRTRGTHRVQMRKRLVKCTEEALVYNMRGIAETSNFMLKTNFSKTISAKDEASRENTVSLRIIGHNLRRIADLNLFRAMEI